MIDESEFHIWAAVTKEERENKKKSLEFFLKYLKDCESIADLGCGDGVFLELLQSNNKKAIGVEFCDEMVELCKSHNLDVVKENIAEFIDKQPQNYDAYTMLDLMEHLDFETNIHILNKIPKGSLIIMKTPNTNSVVGHQYYLQSPGHKMPYSPFVINKMLDRTGFSKIDEGELDFRRFYFGYGKLYWPFRMLLRIILGNYFYILFGGGNYFVVARKK